MMIRETICDKYREVNPRVLDVGRVLELCLIGCDHFLNLFNVHIDPNYSLAQKKRVIDVLAQSIQHGMHNIFMGDFNFVHSNECRYNGHDKQEVANGDPTAVYKEDKMTMMTECFQPEYTRRQMLHSELHSLSRLDRIYSSLPSVDLMDSSIQCQTYMSVVKQSLPSDHTPFVRSLSLFIRL